MDKKNSDVSFFVSLTTDQEYRQSVYKKRINRANCVRGRSSKDRNLTINSSKILPVAGPAATTVLESRIPNLSSGTPFFCSELLGYVPEVTPFSQLNIWNVVTMANNTRLAKYN